MLSSCHEHVYPWQKGCFHSSDITCIHSMTQLEVMEFIMILQCLVFKSFISLHCRFFSCFTRASCGCNIFADDGLRHLNNEIPQQLAISKSTKRSPFWISAHCFESPAVQHGCPDVVVDNIVHSPKSWF